MSMAGKISEKAKFGEQMQVGTSPNMLIYICSQFNEEERFGEKCWQVVHIPWLCYIHIHIHVAIQ